MTNSKTATKNKAKAKNKKNGKPVRNMGLEPVARRGRSAENYRHCVMGPVAMPSSNLGYPDGDNRPTVTMDYRRTYTMKPDSGSISFGIGTSYYGCFIKGTGVCTTNVPVPLSCMQSAGTLSPLVTSSTLGSGGFGVVPIIPPQNDYPFPAYRPLVAVAEVTFTGSTMANGGAVVIAKTSTANPLMGIYGTGEVALYQANTVDPTMSGTSVVGAARDSYVSRIVPADPEFIPAANAATSVSTTSSTLVTNALHPNSDTGRKLASHPCPQAGCVWYEYSGLDSSASVTVSVRYCVQYAVDGNSAFVPMARPSPPPPEAPGVLSRMFSAITNSPAALTFAANSLGHFVPQTKPLLAIAAHAYNS